MQQLGERSDLRAVVDAAAGLAAAGGEGAARSTTVGQERAILRQFGVAGVDRAGRPLAAEVVDRYLAPDPRRLAGGIPAVRHGDGGIRPRAARHRARGGRRQHRPRLEAELLASRIAGPSLADATRLARKAMDRVDANRTAGAGAPRAAGGLARPARRRRARRACDRGRARRGQSRHRRGRGPDRVDVPPGRELAQRMARIGRPSRRGTRIPRRGRARAADPGGPPIAGAQRALAVLRRFVDEAGARRRGYVRAHDRGPGARGADQAVVAAFERIDIVVADPMAGEIVAGASARIVRWPTTSSPIASSPAPGPGS
jgi:hypothetical protein